MLTSNLLGLLAGLTIFTGQALASPILARQDAAEGVVIGHDIQGMSRLVPTVLRPADSQHLNILPSQTDLPGPFSPNELGSVSQTPFRVQLVCLPTLVLVIEP
jgi:hypothetical protein